MKTNITASIIIVALLISLAIWYESAVNIPNSSLIVNSSPTLTSLLPSATSLPTPTVEPSSTANVTIYNTGKMELYTFPPGPGIRTMGNLCVDIAVTIENNGYMNGFNASGADFVLTAGNAGMASPPTFHSINGFDSVYIPNGGNYTGTLVFQLTGDLEGSFNGGLLCGWYLSYSTISFNIIMIPNSHMNN